MKKASVLLAVMALCVPQVVHAGIVSISCEFPTSGNDYQWDFDYSQSVLTVNETLNTVGLNPITITGETDSDPTFTIVKTITNNSGVDWTGYILTLSGSDNPTFVAGAAGAGAGKLQTVDYPDATTIIFSGANPVLPGELLSIQFDMVIPTSGLFDFQLGQQPVPEPTTMALLGLGGLSLLRKRKL